MVPPGKGRVSAQSLHLFAGIQSGIVGGAAMLAVLITAAKLEGQPAWVVPNLLGSIVYRHDAVGAAFTRVTLAGLALQFFFSGVVGMLFGVVVGDMRNRLRVVLLGVLAALVWFYGSQALFWRKLGFLATLYVSPKALVLAHITYGLVLGWYPGVLRSLRRQVAGGEMVEAAPAPPVDRVE